MSRIRLIVPAVLMLAIAYGYLIVAKGTVTSVQSGKGLLSQHPERETLKLPLKDPRIVITKSRRQLELYSDGAVVRTYRVGLGLNPVDDKQKEGDRATPEGEFYIFTKNPKSAYYLSLGISYPNIEDAERGLREGLITRAQHDQIVNSIKKKIAPPQYTALGGLIYIHGNGAASDWTWGCIALENEDIKELYGSVERGTPVTIKR
jgi:murein L,D-transpeptidase YafK